MWVSVWVCGGGGGGWVDVSVVWQFSEAAVG